MILYVEISGQKREEGPLVSFLFSLVDRRTLSWRDQPLFTRLKMTRFEFRTR